MCKAVQRLEVPLHHTPPIDAIHPTLALNHQQVARLVAHLDRQRPQELQRQANHNVAAHKRSCGLQVAAVKQVAQVHLAQAVECVVRWWKHRHKGLLVVQQRLQPCALHEKHKRRILRLPCQSEQHALALGRNGAGCRRGRGANRNRCGNKRGRCCCCCCRECCGAGLIPTARACSWQRR